MTLCSFFVNCSKCQQAVVGLSVCLFIGLSCICLGCFIIALPTHCAFLPGQNNTARPHLPSLIALLPPNCPPDPYVPPIQIFLPDQPASQVAFPREPSLFAPSMWNFLPVYIRSMDKLF